MKSIGIKLADGSFYPLLEEGNPEKRTLDLTTVMDNQTKVQVEVYRTETGSMENAEYIDTLEIENLKPHENGEPTLCLAIDVDENNELSAEIRDPETGKKSEIQVTLQSRTLAGLNNPVIEEEEDDVTISDDDLEKAGLDDFVEKKEFESEEIPLPAEDFSFDDVNEPSHSDETTEPDVVPEETSADEEIFGESSLDLPDFGNMDGTDGTEESTEETAAEETVVPEEDSLEDETFVQDAPDVPAEEENFDDMDFTMPDETETESETEAAVNSGDDFGSVDLPDFDESMFDADAGDLSAEESVPDEEPTASGDDVFAETEDKFTQDTSDDTTEPESFSLPDFDDEEPETNENDSTSIDGLDLPDFDDLEATDLGSSETSDSLGDFSAFDDGSKSLTDNSEDFTLPPDFDTDFGESDLKNDDQPKNPTFAPSTSMFSNLYDKETLEGTSGTYDYEEKEEKNRTKAPMIICIICAIICIIAVLLTLFVLPSSLNIFSKAEPKEAVLEEEPSEGIQETVQEEPVADIVIEEIAPAKEDTIVVAETPAAVVPAEPEPLPEKIPDIRYKIVWGDTLWDISTAYYKTPWKYKKIARYNKIRNPDHIISGTYILIPAE